MAPLSDVSIGETLPGLTQQQAALQCRQKGRRQEARVRFLPQQPEVFHLLDSADEGALPPLEALEQDLTSQLILVRQLTGK